MNGRPGIRLEVRRRFWGEIRAGALVGEAAAAVGVSSSVAWGWFGQAGGVMPAAEVPSPGAVCRLSFAERE